MHSEKYRDKSFIENFDTMQAEGHKRARERHNREGLSKRLVDRYRGPDSGYRGSALGELQNSGKGKDKVLIRGLGLERLAPNMEGSLTQGMDEAKIAEMFDNLAAPHKENLSDEEREKANKSFDQGVLQYKNMIYNQLKRMEATYGTLPSQMHPEDFLRQVGPEYHDHIRWVQDSTQLMQGGAKYFDFENNEKDKDFKRLESYYSKMQLYEGSYGHSLQDMSNLRKESGRKDIDKNWRRTVARRLNDYKKILKILVSSIHFSRKTRKGSAAPA